LKKTTVIETENVTLTCGLESYPFANVTWSKDGIILDGPRITSLHPWSYGSSVASLTIRNVSWLDEGSYKCNASSGIGNAISTAELVVNCKYHNMNCTEIPFTVYSPET